MTSETVSHRACIGLGSNLGRSRQLLQDAWQTLEDHPAISCRALSPAYKTRPVDMNSQHWFINAAGLLQTSLAPEALLDILLQVEEQFGRSRSGNRPGYQDRTLDLDLLLYDDLVMHSATLILPHPAMHERLFVLLPLAAIGPRLLHPRQNKTIAELLALKESESDISDIYAVDWQE